MKYKYEDWILYKKDISLRCNVIKTLYFFSKRTPNSGTPCELPDGFKPVISVRTGLPLLEKENIC